MVSGAGNGLNARNASSASRSISPRGSARSSEANASSPSTRAVVERLDPEAVAREHEPPPARVPDRDGEHAAQALGEAVAVLLVEMEQHFGVAVRAEVMPGALELAAQLAVVVDLAVLDDVQGAVLVRDRLVARLEVDDREAPRGEGDVAVAELSEAVRARGERASALICRDAIRHGGAVRRRDSADPTHGGSV